MSIIEFGKQEVVDAETSHGGVGVITTKTEIKKATDAINSDYWLKAERKSELKGGMMKLIPIPEQELWACARKNPKAKFITKHMPNEAFRNKWNYCVPDVEDEDSLPKELDSRLQKIRKKYKLRTVHKRAVWFARAVGRVLVHKFPYRPITDPNGEWYLRVTHIEDQRIFYDADGNPDYYRPSIYLGREVHDFRIPANKAVLYVNNPDPTGNGYEGLSELEATYFPMIWMSNILESWAEIMEQRGLGILDIMIEGADEPTLKKYKSEYGDPSDYSVIFHDEKWKISTPSAVSAQYNLDTMVAVYTKEISSAAAVGSARMNGVQQGATTGSNLDADNYGQTLGAIQQEWNDELIALHVLCDPTVRDKFDITYDLSVRLDKKQVIENFGSAINGVNQALDFLTYNQALALLDKPAVKDGDMLASKWIATHVDYDETVQPGDKMPDAGTPAPNMAAERMQQEKKNEKRDETAIRKPDRKSADTLTRKELSELKKKKAKELFKAVDNNGDSFSLNEINAMIKQEFGSGLSNSTLVNLR